jgi:hypothetical protein
MGVNAVLDRCVAIVGDRIGRIGSIVINALGWIAVMFVVGGEARRFVGREGERWIGQYETISERVSLYIISVLLHS